MPVLYTMTNRQQQQLNRMPEKTDINIDQITKWIQDEKCILILGPDIETGKKLPD